VRIGPPCALEVLSQIASGHASVDLAMSRILVVSPVPTHPPIGGNRERIRQLLREMGALGHEAHLLYVTLEPDGDVEAMRDCWRNQFHLLQYDPAGTPNGRSPSFHRTLFARIVRRALFHAGVDYAFPHAADDWYDGRLGEALRELQDRWRFDQVWLEYLFLSRGLEVLPPGVVRVLDTLDVFTDRHRRYRRHGQVPRWFSTTRREERKALRRSHLIIAIQEEESRFFRELVPEKRVVTVGHLMELRFLPFKVDPPLTLLFLASQNQINLHGLRMFMDEVFPRIRQEHPGARLLLAGTVCRAVPEDPAYVRLGEFTHAGDTYAKADVVISPIPFGTGLKVKNMEALGYGKPLVTTPAGADGIDEGANRAFFLATTPEEFAARVNELLADSDLRRRTAAHAYEFAEAYRKKNVDSLRSVLECGSPIFGGG
jgi:glycosyltransferase involved in cell wall biosynthesis